MGRARGPWGLKGMAGQMRRGYKLGGACGGKKGWAGPARDGPMEWGLSGQGGVYVGRDLSGGAWSAKGVVCVQRGGVGRCL